MKKTNLINNLFVETDVKYKRPQIKGYTFINKFSIILGILCIMYFFVVLMMNTDLFMLFWLAAGIFFIALGIIRAKQNDIYRQKHKVFRFVFYLLFWIGIICFSVIESFIVFDGLFESNAKPDVAIVLGAGLWGDTPTRTLTYRLNTAIEYLNENSDSMVVVTGGQGADETISEAEAMEIYLVNHGIMKERIIKEDKARNTAENFSFTREKLDSLGYSEYKSAMVITNSFHIFRSKALARKNGFEAYGMPAKSYPYLIPNYYVREVFALVKSLLF